MVVVRTSADLAACLASDGPVGVLIGVQGGHVLDGSLANVARLRELGVRMFAPAHVMDNALVGSSTGRSGRRADRLRAGGHRRAGGAVDPRGPGAHVDSRRGGVAPPYDAALHVEPHRADGCCRRTLTVSALLAGDAEHPRVARRGGWGGRRTGRNCHVDPAARRLDRCPTRSQLSAWRSIQQVRITWRSGPTWMVR